MFNAACQIQEILNMRLCNLNTQNSITSIVVFSKGGKKRIADLTNDTAKLVKEFVSKWHSIDTDTTPLFFIADRNGNKRTMRVAAAEKRSIFMQIKPEKRTRLFQRR